jgi:DNA gyrase/topoisomerase IV subunit A
MKSIIAFFLIIITACSPELPEKKVPEKVIETFKSQFQGASKVKWRKEKKWYEAKFKLNKQEKTVLYDKNAKMLILESAVTAQQLPTPALKVLSRDFNEFKIKDVTKIESSHPVIYEIEIQNNEQGKEIFIDSEGKILKETATNQQESKRPKGMVKQ